MTLYYFDGYPVDVVLESSDTAESDVTEFEVEDGTSFTDHIRNKPREATFTVFISNSPLGEVLAERGDAVEGVSFTDEALAVFEAIRDNRLPIVIEAPLRHYDNMALTSLGEPMSVEDGNGQRFEVAFRQITVVKTARSVVTLPRAQSPKRYGPGRDSLLGAEKGKMILAHDPKTGKNAYYFPDSGNFYDTDFKQIKKPGGLVPMDFDQSTDRWVDPKTGKPFQDLPPVSTGAAGATTHNPSTPASTGWVTNTWWDK